MDQRTAYVCRRQGGPFGCGGWAGSPGHNGHTWGPSCGACSPHTLLHSSAHWLRTWPDQNDNGGRGRCSRSLRGEKYVKCSKCGRSLWRFVVGACKFSRWQVWVLPSSAGLQGRSLKRSSQRSQFMPAVLCWQSHRGFTCKTRQKDRKHKNYHSEKEGQNKIQCFHSHMSGASACAYLYVLFSSTVLRVWQAAVGVTVTHAAAHHSHLFDGIKLAEGSTWQPGNITEAGHPQP